MTTTKDGERLDSPSAQPGGPGRIRALDGLRAIAVLAVMFFHTSSAPLVGGFLGVDIFFVLSGFLIAGILLDQWDREGSLRLTRFWLRRARRLAPALLLLLVTLSLARLAVAQVSADTWRSDILAALTYTTNWYQILTGADYFSAFGMASPLMHTWSLAIEEQFYLAFAIVVALLVPRLRRRTLGVIFGLLALIAAAYMYWLADRDPVSAYYSTATRVQALLVGAALAVVVRSDGSWWRPRQNRGRTLVGGLGLLGVLVAFLLPVPTSAMFRGGFLLVALLTACLIWGLLGDSAMTRVLAWRPLVALGVISYGVYLWHWPIFLWLGTQASGSLGRQLWAIVLTILIAIFSYAVVEKPLRQGRFIRWPANRQWLAYLLAAAGLTLLALLPARTFPPDRTLQWPAADQVPDRVFVGGDSTMFALASQFPSQRYPDTQVGGPTAIGCGLVTMPYDNAGQVIEASQCNQWPAEWQKEISARNPQVSVVGSAVWDTFDRSVDGVARPPGTAEFDRAYAEAFQRAARIASDEGRIPVYVLGVPCMQAQIDQVVLNNQARTQLLSSLIREAVATVPSAHFVDLAPLTCRPDGTAIIYRDGRLLRDDGVHWTQAGAEEVWSLLLHQMDADGAATAGTPSMTP